MARRTTTFATFATLVALALTPPPAQAQTAPAADSTPGSQWLKWNEATKTVTFELIAGLDGGKSPFNFNGYTDGEASLIVPPASTVVMNFVQKDGTPHSAELIADKEPMPSMPTRSPFRSRPCSIPMAMVTGSAAEPVLPSHSKVV